MKANEVPKKVYLHLTTGNRLLNGKYCERKPAKIRVDDKIIEYIRTDAFIEKADKWLSLNLKMLMNVLDVEYNTHETDVKDFVEDFKNYMKRE